MTGAGNSCRSERAIGSAVAGPCINSRVEPHHGCDGSTKSGCRSTDRLQPSGHGVSCRLLGVLMSLTQTFGVFGAVGQAGLNKALTTVFTVRPHYLHYASPPFASSSSVQVTAMSP